MGMGGHWVGLLHSGLGVEKKIREAEIKSGEALKNQGRQGGVLGVYWRCVGVVGRGGVWVGPLFSGLWTKKK